MEGPDSRICELLEQPATPTSICAARVGKFEVGPAVCRAETTALLDDMTERELLVCGLVDAP